MKRGNVASGLLAALLLLVAVGCVQGMGEQIDPEDQVTDV